MWSIRGLSLVSPFYNLVIFSLCHSLHKDKRKINDTGRWDYCSGGNLTYCTYAL